MAPFAWVALSIRMDAIPHLHGQPFPSAPIPIVFVLMKEFLSGYPSLSILYFPNSFMLPPTSYVPINGIASTRMEEVG
jgi:hypothetical protein